MNPRGSSGSRRCATIVLRRASLWRADNRLCRLAIVVFQQSTELFAASERVSTVHDVFWCGHEGHIPLALVGAFLVIMGVIRRERMPQKALAKQEQPRQGVLFHRADP